MNSNQEKKAARIIVVEPNGSIILNRRPDWSKQAPGKLQILGGKRNSEDESDKHTAQREIMEELGILEKTEKFIYLCQSKNNGWITIAFILLLDEAFDESQIPNHEEFDSIEKISSQVILSLIQNGEIAFDHPKIIKKYLNKNKRLKIKLIFYDIVKNIFGY